MNQNLNGYILIDKPSGWSSFDCVHFIKSKYQIKKAGHAGALDPIASGLLIIMINNATKYFDLFQTKLKAYDATLLLGLDFDTKDITGKPLKISIPSEIPDETMILNALKSFEGETTQIPPVFSALKVNGRPSYKYARSGTEIELTGRNVFIEKIELNYYKFPHISFRIFCKKGFYVRTLCSDIAEKLNLSGVLTSLRRIEQFSHTINDAIDFNNLPDDISPYINNLKEKNENIS